MTNIPRSHRPQSDPRNAGAAVVEFAITAPLLVLLALGAADYGAMMAQSDALAAYARAGAEYARSQIIAGNGLPSDASIKTSLNLPSSVSVNFSATDPYCTCSDGTSVACPTQSSAPPPTCLALTDTRVLEYLSVTMTQSPTPLVSYTPLPFSTAPWSLSNTMVVR